MAYPTKYTRQYDFQGYQVSNPTRPLPGNKVNVDLDAAKSSIGEIVEFLKTSIRADGQLANGSVGVNQLDATFDLGFSLPTTWAAGVAYTTDSTVFYANKFYKANVAHTSTDGFDESKWGLIVDFGAEADAAAASATAALASQNAAASSAAASASSATSSANSATASSNSATAASGSATTATTQATAASTSATAAATSQTNAATSATNAAASATAAAASAASITFASQAEAEAGTSSTKVMSPLRTAQAIAALSPSTSFGTKALAQAFAPETAPDFIRLWGHTTPGVGGALYRKVASQPSHPGKFSITLSDAVTVVWYEISEKRLDVLMFGAVRDQAGVDSWQAFKDCLDTVKAQATSADFRYGGPIYVPAGQYELSTYLLINAPGIRLVGDGSTASVVKAQSPFVAEAIIWHIPQNTTSVQVGAGLIGIGIDCNEQTCRGYLGESVYDNVVYDDVRINRVHADWVGFHLRPQASNSIDVCQTIDIRSLFVGKYTQKGTVPAVLLDRCQEVNIWSSKAWNGFGITTDRGTQAPWFIQDCRAVNMYGCSYASSQRAGIVVYAATRDVDQVSLHSPTFENLTSPVETLAETGFIIINLRVANSRHESPVSAGYVLKSVVRGYVECNQQAVSLDAACNVTKVQVDLATQVTNLGVNTTIEARA